MRLTQVLAAAHALVVASSLRTANMPTAQLHAHFLGRTVEVALAAKAICASVVSVSATGHAGDVTNPLSPVRLRELVHRLDAVVCASTVTARALAGLIGVPEVPVVRCGVPASAAAATVLEGRPPIRLLSVGRLVEKKGFADCVAAARRLIDTGHAIKWIIVGDGPLQDDLVKQVEELQLSDHVALAGHLSNPAVLTLMKDACDVLVMPCKVASDGDSDGIPVALLEAMSMGIPIVTTDVGGISELIVDGDTGFITEPGSPVALAASIARVVDDAVQARAVGRRGSLRVKKDFSSAAEGEKMRRLFAQLLERAT